MSTPTDHGSCSACGWRLPLLLAIVLAAILLSQSRGIREAIFKPSTAPPPGEASDQPSAQRVLLSINFGDGRPLQNESALWQEDMTVADLLNGEPRISVASQGSGKSAFLTELNGIANEGAGGRNWIYSVNGKPADRSFGAYELQPNDHVLWTFAAGE